MKKNYIKKLLVVIAIVLGLTFITLVVLTHYNNLALESKVQEEYFSEYLTQIDSKWLPGVSYLRYDYCNNSIFSTSGHIVQWSNIDYGDEIDTFLTKIYVEKDNVWSFDWRVTIEGRVKFDDERLSDIENFGVTCSNIDDNENPNREWSFRYPLSEKQREAIENIDSPPKTREFFYLSELNLFYRSVAGDSTFAQDTLQMEQQELLDIIDREVIRIESGEGSSEEFNQLVARIRDGQTFEEYMEEVLEDIELEE